MEKTEITQKTDNLIPQPQLLKVIEFQRALEDDEKEHTKETINNHQNNMQFTLQSSLSGEAHCGSIHFRKT